MHNRCLQVIVWYGSEATSQQPKLSDIRSIKVLPHTWIHYSMQEQNVCAISSSSASSQVCSISAPGLQTGVWNRQVWIGNITFAECGKSAISAELSWFNLISPSHKCFKRKCEQWALGTMRYTLLYDQQWSSWGVSECKVFQSYSGEPSWTPLIVSQVFLWLFTEIVFALVAL